MGVGLVTISDVAVNFAGLTVALLSIVAAGMPLCCINNLLLVVGALSDWCWGCCWRDP